MISTIAFSAARLSIIVGFIGSIVFNSQEVFCKGINSSVLNQFVSSIQPENLRSDSLQLTEQKVKKWINTRIAVAKLQNQMKNNAADYDNVIEEFFTEREILLSSRGWSVGDFDDVKERIHAAITAMDIEGDLNETREDHEEEIVEIRDNEFFSEKQKEEMINGLESMREQKRKLYVDPVKSDLPAVRPYRAILQQMINWIAGNTENPPVLD